MKLEEWLQRLQPSQKELRWILAAGCAAGLGQLLWRHYGILRHRRLPDHDLGLPLLGHTLEIFKHSLEGWGRKVMSGRCRARSKTYNILELMNWHKLALAEVELQYNSL